MVPIGKRRQDNRSVHARRKASSNDRDFVGTFAQSVSNKHGEREIIRSVFRLLAQQEARMNLEIQAAAVTGFHIIEIPCRDVPRENAPVRNPSLTESLRFKVARQEVREKVGI